MHLVIDGNAFINVAISITKAVTSKDKRIGEKYYVDDLFNEGHFLLKEGVKLSFKSFCFTYFSSLIGPIDKVIDKVHIVFDSKSWRKSYTNSFFEEKSFKTSSAPAQFEYKGHRKYDNHQNLFFEYFHQSVLPALHECGVNSYKVKGAEGDDLIAYLCETLASNILIYSVDLDLKQLVHNSKEGSILLIVPKQMSKNKKLFISNSRAESTSSAISEDFFDLDGFMESDVEKTIKNLHSKDYIEYQIDPQEELVMKLLLGDKSDNIPKISNLGAKKAEFIYNRVKERFGKDLFNLIDSQNEDFISFIISEVATLTKVKDQDKIDELREHLLFNIKTIRLSTKVLPEDILEAIQTLLESYSMTKFSTKTLYSLKNNLSAI